jgi:hypothetical protein
MKEKNESTCPHCGKPAVLASLSCHGNECSAAYHHDSREDSNKCKEALLEKWKAIYGGN